VGPPEGLYQLSTSDINTGPAGDQYSGLVLANLLSASDNATSASFASPVLPSLLNVQLVDLRNVSITQQRVFNFSDGPNTTFLINGEMYDPSRIDVSVTLGDVEEWILVNPSPNGEFHVFHSHQLGFQVISINNITVQFEGYQETVNIPFATNDSLGNTIPGEVVIRMPFTDPAIVGVFPFHCHIMEHEEAGMMALIEVKRSNRLTFSGGHSLAAQLVLVLLCCLMVVILCEM